MSLLCKIDSDCGRLQICFQGQVCHHIDIFQSKDPTELVALCTFSIFCGFASAGNFGAGAVQVVYLLLWLNYSRREASGITQPILVGICLASWIRTRGRKHPLRNSSIIDYQLAALLLPCMLGPYIAALHLRYYLPPFALSLFIVVQILFMMLNTFVKLRQTQRIQNAHMEVREHIKRLGSLSDDHDSDPVNKVDIFEALPTLTHDHDDVYIDFQHIFKIIAKSKYRDVYLSKLPPEIRDNQFIDLDTDEQVKVESYLVAQYGEEKLIKFQQQEDEENVNVLATQPKNKFTDLKHTQRKIVKAQDLYEYPHPGYEIGLMVLVIAFNVINFLLMGGIQLPSIIGIVRCTTQFWILFGFQIGGNYILYTFIFAAQKVRHDRIYVDVTSHMKSKQDEYDIQYEYEVQQLKYLTLQKESRRDQITNLQSAPVETEMTGLTKRLSQKEPDDYPKSPGLKVNLAAVLHQKIHHKGARIDIKYNSRSYSTVILVGLLGGALMGFVGVGTSLLMVMVIGRLRINLASMVATLPMLVVFTCILGSLMQIALGQLQYQVALLFFGLAFVGSFVIAPLFSKAFVKLHLAQYIIMAAFVFQLIILIIYLYLWIPEIKKDFSKFIQYSSFTALC